MKLNQMAMANSMAMAGAALYVLCAGAVLLFPSMTRGMFNTWFHGIDMSTIPMRGVFLIPSIWGLITFSIFAWIFGYALAYFYNQGTRK